MAESEGGSMGKGAGLIGGVGCLVIVALLCLVLIVPLLVTVLVGGIAGQLSLSGGDDCVESVSAEGGDGAVNIPEAFKKPLADAAKVAGLPEQTAAAQIKLESNFDTQAGSPAGAQGPAQFTPETWARYGAGGDIHDIEDSMSAYGRYMKALREEVKPLAGDDANKLVRLTLAAYNAGPGAVQKAKGIPPFEETRVYVEKITGSAQMEFSGGCKAVEGGKSWNGDLGKGEWTIPLPDGKFTSGYGGRNVPGLPAWAQNHVGVDLSTGGGAPIIAPADMTVTGTLENDHCVMAKMDGEPGFQFAFCHVESLNVKKGQKIKRGKQVGIESGFMGGSPSGAAKHLHFEIYKPNCGNGKNGGANVPYDGCNIDPEPILKEKGAWVK